MSVLEDLTEEEAYLWSIISDASGLDLGEFCIVDELNDHVDKKKGQDGSYCFRAWPFQWPWWRDDSLRVIEQGSRCVAEGQLVLTSTGWKPIEDIQLGEMVMTHLSRWRRVTGKFDQGEQSVVRMKGHGHPEGIVITPNHRIWVRQIGHIGGEWIAPEDFGDRLPYWGSPSGLAFDHEIRSHQGETVWGPITSVSPCGEARVWDLQVEEDESFVLEGVSVHNSLGKSWSIKFRAMAFAFNFPGSEMLITAPEGVHLDAITDAIEGMILNNQIPAEMIVKGRQGFKHRPFVATFQNGAHIIGRIPQRDGRGVKGTHPVLLELDEACFPAETLIITADGHKPIEEVNVGDLVLTHKGRWRPVLNVWDRGVRDVLRVKIQGHPGVVSTYNHRFYARSKYSSKVRWIPALYLTGCDVTQPHSIPGLNSQGTEDRWLRFSMVTSVTPNGRQRVYDLEVEEDHSFVAEGIVVHNSDYPEAGWKELIETVNKSAEKGRWRAHGVTRGMGDDSFYKYTQPDSGWKVHHLPAMYRPTWSDEEREEKISLYTSREDPDYRRNVLGKHGDATSPLFDVHRLGQCGLGSTPVLVMRDDLEEQVSLSDICIGEKVLNATGCGEVVCVTESEHTSVCEVSVAGESLFFSEDHPFFTQRGWVAAGDLEPGDQLFSREAMQELWSQPDLPPSQELMSGRLGETGLSMPDLRYIIFAEWVNASVPEGMPAEEPAGEGCLAGLPRVESVKTHHQGTEEFLRLSEGRDTVTLYDLTVSGHPSFFVGGSGVLVHNCLDDDRDSEYNTSIYYDLKFDEGVIHRRNDDPTLVIDPPSSHVSKFSNFWMGMDVGFTTDPSVIVIFAEEMKNARTPSQLRLLAKITMKGVQAGYQAEAMLHLFDIYRPRGFSMDSTGIGLPLFQIFQMWARDDSNPDRADLASGFLEVLKPYNFSQSIIVEFDDSVDEIGSDGDKAQIKRNVKEWATDCLRVLVDEQRLILPYDQSLMSEFRGQSWRNLKDTRDQYGRKRAYSKGYFHTLDATRMAVLGWKQRVVDLYIKEREVTFEAPPMTFIRR